MVVKSNREDKPLLKKRKMPLSQPVDCQCLLLPPNICSSETLGIVGLDGDSIYTGLLVLHSVWRILAEMPGKLGDAVQAWREIQSSGTWRRQ